MKQVVYGLSLAFITAMLVFIFRDQPVVTQSDPVELLGPFLYLIIVTHYMGHLSYIRGAALLRRRLEAEETSKLDFLTGLNNRRSMFDKAKLNDKNLKKNAHKTTVIMADIDHFKLVNDTHGHNHGDAVLIQVSELIKSSLRDTDIVARWGGEEFLVLLAKTDTEQGVSIAEKIRETIANNPFIYEGVEHKVTLTLGLASYDSNSNFEETIQRADQALYEGKENGRNRVVTFDPASVDLILSSNVEPLVRNT
jgi:diguanylate cyclase (GGDEF)-like protein